MLNQDSISQYQYSQYKINENSLVVPPQSLLCSYIANYTFTNPSTMSKQQTILPTISSTIVCSKKGVELVNGLRGVNTKPIVIGDYARQFDFMFLIEFHAGGLYPFIGVNQNELTDKGFLLEQIDMVLDQDIKLAYETSKNIEKLVYKLDDLFLSRLNIYKPNFELEDAFKRLLESKGNYSVKELANTVHYSEKQLNRLFLKYIGANVKTCSRIIRMKKYCSFVEQNKYEFLARINRTLRRITFCKGFY